ncbi:DUF6602 domain-containing protein [Rhodococcus ruber]|uniref:DUF6602 domain-containing protein n=1 Tax=Rhodococcus ruber TaxID=1830 RepID=UPI001F3428B1|nr:DUF6602 domain-containing protein [Rhodococcus ruber]MCF8785230.1 hypothetical protein [Rhodococcus ruber]
MTEENKLRQLFSRHQELLVSALGVSSVHEHPVAKGDNSELAWREMLSKHLPNRYQVATGIVIDHEGTESDYIDIIIFDRYYSPIVFHFNDVLYVPAESVFAVIEAKQSLNKSHVDYASKKAKSVRALKRTSAPIRQMNSTLATKADTKQILAGIVTTKSDWSPALGDPFNRALAEAAKASPIDFGCSLNDGSFSITYNDAGEPTIVKSDSNSSLISFFVGLVSELQAMGNPPAIDLQKYYQRS